MPFDILKLLWRLFGVFSDSLLFLKCRGRRNPIQVVSDRWCYFAVSLDLLVSEKLLESSESFEITQKATN